MTTNQTAGTAQPTVETIESALVQFLESKTKVSVQPEDDLFATGVVSSMFAMELVLHLEQSYRIAILGGNLDFENFRTVQAMAALVRRLLEAPEAASDV